MYSIHISSNSDYKILNAMSYTKKGDIEYLKDFIVVLLSVSAGRWFHRVVVAGRKEV